MTSGSWRTAVTTSWRSSLLSTNLPSDRGNAFRSPAAKDRGASRLSLIFLRCASCKRPADHHNRLERSTLERLLERRFFGRRAGNGSRRGWPDAGTELPLRAKSCRCAATVGRQDSSTSNAICYVRFTSRPCEKAMFKSHAEARQVSRRFRFSSGEGLRRPSSPG